MNNKIDELLRAETLLKFSDIFHTFFGKTIFNIKIFHKKCKKWH